MQREKDFVVNITKLTKAVNQKGFGLIMIYDVLSDRAYTLYENISQILEDFSADSKVYKIASRIFGQNPKPQKVAVVGNTKIVETQGVKAVYTLTIEDDFTNDDVISINGIDYKYKDGTFSKDKNEFSGSNINEKISNLAELISGFEINFSIESNSNQISFTQKTVGFGDKPVIVKSGNFTFRIEESKKEKLKDGLISFLGRVREKYQEPFFLVCTDNSSDTIKKLSNFVDSANMMYFVTSANISAAKLVNSENTVIMYHDDENAYVAEGLASYLSTAKVGAVTAKFKEIKGVKEANITTTQLDELHKNNGFSYVEKMGILQTSEGKTTSGEYIDVVMGSFFIKFKMEEELFYLAANSEKIGFDNKGISKMVAVCNSVLKKAAFEQNIILIDNEGNAIYKVEYIPREDTSANDIANRNYTGIKWSAKLSGAIHKATISGTLEY